MSKIEAYIHKESDTFLTKIDIRDFPITTMVYKKDKFILNQLKKLKTGYIITPCYDYKYKKMEIQLGITGKKKTTETFHQAFQREILEEIGIKINKNFEYVTVPDNKLNIKFSVITQNNLSHKIIKSNNSEDGLDKIISLIHFKDIDTNIIFRRKRMLSNDIAGTTILIISVENMITLYEKFIKKHLTKYNRFCYTL